MNNLNETPDASALERKLALLHQADPRAGFLDGLEKELLNRATSIVGLEKRISPISFQRPFPHRLFRQKAWLAAIFLLLLLTVFFATPQGRAWAQNALRFFTRTESNQLILPTPTTPVISLIEVTPNVPVPTLTPTPGQPLPFYSQCGDESFPKCTLDQIRSKVSFPVKALANIPNGLKFVGATGGPERVILMYRSTDLTRALFLTEERRLETEAQPPKGLFEMGIAADTTVESVQIGDKSGEYVQGMWNGSAGSEGLAWDPNQPIQILRWMGGKIFYELYLLESPDQPGSQFGKEGLLRLANDLTASSTGQTASSETATPEAAVDNLSIQEAEALAGFKLLLPAELPREYTFDHASYSSELKTVCLTYKHPKDVWGRTTLSIAESATTPLPLLTELYHKDPNYGYVMKAETVTVGGAAFGRGLYASGSLDTSRFCHIYLEGQVLQVQTEGVQFSIFASDYFAGGHNFVTRLEMVKLAESMTGIHTVPDDQLDPEYLHSVKDAEAFVGFHIKLPTKLLPGETLDFIRVTQEGQSRSVYIAYQKLGITETFHSQETLDTIYNQDPEAYEKVMVRGQPGLLLQGFWNNGEFVKMENGGDGTIILWWFEDGIEYSIGAMNERGFAKELWLEIAESMQ